MISRSNSGPKQKDGLRGRLVMDIDGTLCPIKGADESYADLVPSPEMVRMLGQYQEQGFIIVLHTSRNMKSFEANVGLINKHTIPTLIKWLEQWSIPYDELFVGKPWPGEEGFYVDDRAVRPDEFLKYSHEQLEAIMHESRARVFAEDFK